MRELLRGMLLSALLVTSARAALGPETERLAESAVETYGEVMIDLAGDLVSFRTVHQEGVANAEHPQFVAMTAYLRQLAQKLGFGFVDHGAAVILTAGDGEARLGLVTHGDVQPADPAQWAADPFSLDSSSEPGWLVARGIEDDKGPIACAIYAMKTLLDADVLDGHRIELVIAYTEESDWQPFMDFMAGWDPPPVNVAIDAEYPLVRGENGWCLLTYGIPLTESPARPDVLSRFVGGAFVSQVPGEAQAVIDRPSFTTRAVLVGGQTQGVGTIDRTDLVTDPPVVEASLIMEYEASEDRLVLRAKGLASHSSKPQEGINAVTHLAALLGQVELAPNAQSEMVAFVNELVGTGHTAEKLGDVAYSHEFMGPLTSSLTLLEEKEGELRASVNLRRPAGRDSSTVDRQIREAVTRWESDHDRPHREPELYVGEPYLIDDAGQVPVLLEVFRHFTGQTQAEPISIGGGTHARLFPNAVNFGPAMPGEPYTGHSEHETMSRDQMMLNLRMLTAALAELTREPRP